MESVISHMGLVPWFRSKLNQLYGTARVPVYGCVSSSTCT